MQGSSRSNVQMGLRALVGKGWGTRSRVAGDGAGIESAYLKELQHRIVRLYRESLDFEFRGYERATTAMVQDCLGDPIVEFVGQAIDLAADLFFACEQGEDTAYESLQARNLTGRNFDLRMDLLVSSSVNFDQASHVADIAFIARAELTQRLQSLQRASPRVGARELVVNLEGGCRRVRKSLMALDAVLAPLLKSRPQIDYVTELASSLRVRAAYFELIEATRAAEPVDEENVHRALRGAGTRIAMIIGKVVYGEMRMADRFRLADLQYRILDWMRDDLEGASGVQIWRDLTGALELFRAISHREELRAHDKEKLTECRIALCSLDDPVQVVLGRPSALALLGLDIRLDDALTGRKLGSRDDVIDLFRTLESRVRPQTDIAAAAAPFI